MPRGPAVVVGIVASYGIIFLLATVLIGDDYRFDGTGSGCRDLNDAAEGEVQVALAILALMFGAWVAALGTGAMAPVRRERSEDGGDVLAAVNGFVIGSFALLGAAVIFFHEPIAILFGAYMIPVALLVRIAGAMIAGAQSSSLASAQKVPREMKQLLVDSLVLAGVVAIGTGALVALLAEPLYPVVNISTC